MRRWSVLGVTNESRGRRHGYEKPRFSTFQNRAYKLLIWGRERTYDARGTHHRIILKFRNFSSGRKVVGLVTQTTRGKGSGDGVIERERIKAFHGRVSHGASFLAPGSSLAR